MDRARLAQAAPVAGPGVDPALLGTIDGPLGQQVTYAGHPLYRFSGDLAAGETNGFGVGGIWWVLAPDGTRIAPPPPPSTQPRSVPAPTAPTAPPETAAEPPPPPPPPPEPPPSYSPPPYDY
jgi:hypothetical protein